MYFKLFFIIFILLNFKKISSENTYNNQYQKYIKNYYDIPSYYEDCKEYFDNFENEILNINNIYKNKLDKIPEYIF